MALMTTMRNRMHIFLWAILILFILSISIGGLVGGANIIDQLFGRVDPSTAIGVINGQKISPDDFSRAVSARLEQVRASGREITDRDFDQARKQVWDDFIREILISQSIKKLEISATNQEVLFHLQNIPPPFLISDPTFQTNGEFDQAKYEEAINNPSGNEWTQIEQFMKDTYIPNIKLQEMVNADLIITNEDVWESYIKQHVNYTIDGVHITTNAVKDDVIEPTEEELFNEYTEKIDDFYREEMRNLEVVSWEKKPSSDDSSRVLDECQEIINQLNNGSDFSELANTYTQDPGNQVSPDSGRGGDLGWFGRGQMVKPFEEAAFVAKAGDVVGPVLSRFGYHIINVNDRRNENDKEEINASHILLKIEMGPNANDALKRKSTLFSYDASDPKIGFPAALDSHQVTTKKVTKILDETTTLQNFGAFRQAVRFAYNSEVNDVSDPMQNDQYFIVAKLDSVLPEGTKSFEEVQNQIKNSINQERQFAQAKKFADQLREELGKGSTFQQLKDNFENIDLITGDTKLLIRSFQSLGKSNYFVGALASANKGDIIGPLKTPRGYGIVNIIDISPIDSSDFEMKRDVIYDNLSSQKRNTNFQSWYQDLLDEAKIIDNRKYYF
ncbi:MAG: peptidylprolyl isomerase [Candidatus Neomarinimicrobiota bacterium]|nr:peptidylprolyl isomerase [Candidatus Neomarinimicrobiota bacterium]